MFVFFSDFPLCMAGMPGHIWAYVMMYKEIQRYGYCGGDSDRDGDIYRYLRISEIYLEIHRGRLISLS